MKKNLHFFIISALLLCEALFFGGGNAFAADSVGTEWTSGNYTYKVLSLNPAEVSIKLASSATPTSISTGTTVHHEGTTYKITQIPSFGFNGCSTAKSLSIGSNITTIGSSAFKGCGFNSTVTIPASVTSIGMDAFWNCTSLKTVSFNVSSPLTTIGTYLFEGCSSLTSVTLPPLLTTLPGYTFKGCTSLTTVTIPASVTTVTNTAFNGCTALDTIVAKPTTAPTLSSAMSGITPSDITLVVYTSASKTSYQGAANWSGFNITTSKSGSCGVSANWELNLATGKLTVSGSGDMYDYSVDKAPWVLDTAYIKSFSIANAITKIGNHAFNGCRRVTSITLPSELTTIGSNAFKYCGFNGTVTIPQKVTSIGTDAFWYCRAMKKVNFNASNTLTDWTGTYIFEDCSALESVALPSTLMTLPGYTFRNCTTLTSLTIPASVTSITETAFSGCTNLDTIHAMPDAAPTVSSAWSSITPASITLQLYSSAAKTSYSADSKWNGFNISTKKSGTCGTSAEWELDFENGKLSITGSGAMTDFASSSSVPWIADTAYIRSISIAKTITKIGNYAFYQHARCTSVTFISTSTVSAIGDYAFKGCKGLTSISLPTSLLTIGTYAFQSCTGLTSISLPSKITSVGNYAYDGCSNATSLTIGYNSNSSRTIGDYAFQNCSKVSSITIPTCVTAIGKYAFNGCSNATTLTFNSTSKVATIGGYAFKGCEKITSVAIPASVTSIGDEVFWNCFALKSATFDAASTLTSIGTWTFDQCSALTTVTLPPLLESIPGNTFNGCSALEILALPATVASITSSSFIKCSSLKTIIANRSTHPTLSGAVTSLTNFTPANVRVAVFSDAAKLDYSGDTYWSAFDIDTKIEGECGVSGNNITYSLDLETGVLTFIGTGAMATYSTSDRAPWYQYRSIITSVVIGSGITGIGAYAFKDCANITTASLPASLTSIGSSVFDGCSASTFTSYSYAGTIAQWLGITFAGTSSNPMNYVKKCFVNGSTEVNALVIPNGTTSIPNYAFYNCLGLTSVTVPASLTSIGDYAFSSCSNIASVNYLGTIDEWCSIAFGTSTSNPAMFSHSLQIGGVEQTTIYLSDELEEIQNYAFYSNTTLTEISLKNTTSMAANSLYGCTADIIVRGQMSGECGTDITWTLEDGVLTISGEGEMSDYLTTGTSPWYSVRSAITKLVVEEGVTTLGEYAFKNLTNLVQVYLSKDVTTIKNYAFYGCSSISYIVSGNATPPAIIDAQTGYSGGAVYGSNVFTSVPTAAVIYVPAGSTTTYSTAQTYSHNTSSGWKRFSNFLPYTGTCGATGNEANVTWTFDPADNSMTISGTGAMADFANSTAMPWNSIKTNITSVVIEEGVTTIGNYAFYGCSALASVTFPETFSTIGNYAFYNCSGLTAIALPEGITATGNSVFYGCTSLASVTLPNTLTSIGSNAFINDALTSIIIPSSVTSIGSGAFKGNAALVSVGLAEAPQLTTIGNSAFENCSSLTSITIPNKVTSIGNSSFSGCSLLAAVNYGDTPTLATIGYSAFKNCSSLTSITIPESVTTITGNSSHNVYAPFAGCTSLTTVIWNARNCSGWTPINYMSSTYYQMPFESIKTQITSFTFGSNVQSIPQYLCHGMTGLTDITIPASVTAIGANAFDGCTNITTVTSNATSVPSIASSTFPSSVEDAATLYVPANVASRTAYTEDTDWHEFGNIRPFILSFDMQSHGDAIDAICVNAGRVDEALQPADPTEDYYTFGGWYTNETCTAPFTFGESGTVVNSDLTLYAKWTENIFSFADTDTDNSKIDAAEGKKASSVTIGRTVWKDGYYNTLCLPFSLSADEIATSPLAGYKALKRLGTATVTGTGENRVLNIQLEPITAITAGEPFLISYEAGENIINPVFNNVTVTAATPGSIHAGDVTCHGIYARTSLGDANTNLFLGTNNTLYWPLDAEHSTMNGLRAYFSIGSSGSAYAGMRVRLTDKPAETPTGIDHDAPSTEPQSTKILRDGVLLILRDGKTYSAQGVRIQ